MEAAFRFLTVAIIALGFALWCGIPLVLGLILILTLGTAAIIWGDKVLINFVAAIRHFK